MMDYEKWIRVNTFNKNSYNVPNGTNVSILGIISTP